MAVAVMDFLKILDEMHADMVAPTGSDAATVTHFWCCNPKKASCGAAIDADTENYRLVVSYEPDDCVVCVDLDSYACEVCCG